MTPRPDLVAPPRLRDGEDRVAELLRLEAHRQEATPRHRAELVVRAYRRSQLRRQLAPGTLAMLSLLGVYWAIRLEPEPNPNPISISAEPIATAEAQRERPPPRPASLPETQREPRRSKLQASAPLEASAATTRPSALRAKLQGQSREGLARPSAKPHTEQRTPISVTECEQLTRAGRYAEAASCYTAVAVGGGLSAELALLERSRLESRVLGKKQAAITTLDEYDRRFNNGALFREAALARIEVLSALGDHSATRKQIRAVRDRIPERAVQLALLGARLAIEDGDCEEAWVDLRYARDRGADGAQLEALESRCR